MKKLLLTLAIVTSTSAFAVELPRGLEKYFKHTDDFYQHNDCHRQVIIAAIDVIKKKVTPVARNIRNFKLASVQPTIEPEEYYFMKHYPKHVRTTAFFQSPDTTYDLGVILSTTKPKGSIFSDNEKCSVVDLKLPKDRFSDWAWY